MIRDGSALNSKDTTNRNANQSDEGANEEDFGEFEFQSESLLSLVQPELLSLSQHWLSALRDHALLSLPPGLIHYNIIIQNYIQISSKHIYTHIHIHIIFYYIY